MSNTVTKIAILYGIMWLLSFWVQNIIFSTIVGGFGVVLLVVVAIGVDNLFGENDDNEARLKIELEKLRKRRAKSKTNALSYIYPSVLLPLLVNQMRKEHHDNV